MKFLFISISVSVLIIIQNASHCQSFKLKNIFNITDAYIKVKDVLGIEEDKSKTSVQNPSRRSADSSNLNLIASIWRNVDQHTAAYMEEEQFKTSGQNRSKTSVQNRLRRSVDSSKLNFLLSIWGIVDQLGGYMENEYKPIEISLDNLEIPDISHQSDTNATMHFQNMRFLQRDFNNNSSFKEDIGFDDNLGVQKTILGLIQWPMKFVGSIILDQSGKNRTVNFSMPFTFHALDMGVYSLPEPGLTLFFTGGLFAIIEPLISVQTEPSFGENDVKFIQDIRTFGLLKFQYLRRQINVILTNAAIKRTPHFSLSLLPNRELDTYPYHIFHTRRNISSTISLYGVQINEVNLQSKALKLSDKVSYSITITTKKITGKVTWYSDYYNRTIPEEKREFSLSAEYIKFKFTSVRTLDAENHKFKIAPLTINIPPEQFQINDEVQNYLTFLKDNLKQIITESFEKYDS